MKKYGKILGLIIGAIILLTVFFNKSMYMDKSTGFVYFGYNGLYSYLSGKEKNMFYYKEYLKYELEGTDYAYVYNINQNENRLIFVDENNTVNNYLLKKGKKISIISANSKIKFEVELAEKQDNAEPAMFSTADKIFAISDIEGDFDFLISMLKGNGVIDERLTWKYNSGHLVLLGDFFDRGNDVNAVLWFCYKLEKEAEKKGGKVHFILGNHEQMNLRGNIKYTNKKYVALAQYIKSNYKELYGNNTVIGNWVRSKNAVEIINDNLFVHGGIASTYAINNISLSELNNQSRLSLDSINRSEFNNGMENPLWYRGYFQDWEGKNIAGQDDINTVCEFYGVNKIIVGHTLVDNIKSRFNGKVIGIDVRRTHQAEQQKASALLIENKNFYAVDQNGKKSHVK